MMHDVERCDNAWCACHMDDGARRAERSEDRPERTAEESNLTELRILLAVTLVLGGVIVYILVSEGLHYAVGP